ncbi:MAG TPA: hypothetical protein VG367_19470 [Mucilaginibacter sp.]|nr:hypothetical protein [Mucilaginibacter sp.]
MNKMIHSRSECIKQAYEAIYKSAISLLSSIEDENMRAVYVLETNPEGDEGYTLHELISPLLYLSLICNIAGDYSIHFGVEERPDPERYQFLTSEFIRLIYKLTMKESTAVNIEDVVHTDWFVRDCSALFECTARTSSKHTLSVIQFKNDFRLN